MDFVSHLVQKYNLSFDGYSDQELVSGLDLIEKWKDFIGEGWYGFDFGSIPQVWVNIIDDFLTHVVRIYPNMTIHQIKVKFGHLDIYLGNVSHEIDLLCRTLTTYLFDSRLVY